MRQSRSGLCREPRKKIRAYRVDPDTGQISIGLTSEKKRPPSGLVHAAGYIPAAAVSYAADQTASDTEEQTVSAESARAAERAAEAGGRLVQSGLHSQRLYTEYRAEKAHAEALYRQSLRETPQPGTHSFSKQQQKRAIRHQYAKKAGHGSSAAAKKSAGAAKKASKEAVREARAVWHFILRHKKGVLIALAVLMVLVLFLSIFSSGALMLPTAGLSLSTFPCEDTDMLGAEAAYAAMEARLQGHLDRYERTHSYDEYHYDLEEIRHDPYVLISLLTAWQQGPWTVSDVQPALELFFKRQYLLREHVTVEVRYRTETDPETGEVQENVPYDYRICTVSLENFNLSHLPIYIMGESQISLYAMFMSTHGNRPDLFPPSAFPHASVCKDYVDYEIPPEALEDPKFSKMIAVAEAYLGFPYVWGGYCPATSFDCSGYVSWIINHSGWEVGRLDAQRLHDMCRTVSTKDARPGDLVFFAGTYDTAGVSHVGMYVGNGWMIHCGNPISYSSLNTPYWQSHLYSYGRLPEP